MPEWLHEAGIGEARAALVADGDILEAAIDVEDGTPRVGLVAQARLIDRDLVRLDTGAEAQLVRPAGVPQGAALAVRIVREAIPEPGRAKLARAVPTDEAPGAAPNLLARLHLPAPPRLHLPAPPRRRPGSSRDTAHDDTHRSLPEHPEAGPRPPPGWSDEAAAVRTLHAHEPDALEAAGWSELLEEARTGDIAFDGGALRMWPTPAMTLFDVDGGGPLDALAVRAAAAVARAIRRHGIGGSVGIDFPTLGGKAARQAVAEALDAALAWPDAPAFERTAVNGFGFLQLVLPRPRASLPERLRADPVGAATRAALRRLEREPPGAFAVHRLPAAILARLDREPGWRAELARRTGVVHRLEPA